MCGRADRRQAVCVPGRLGLPAQGVLPRSRAACLRSRSNSALLAGPVLRQQRAAAAAMCAAVLVTAVALLASQGSGASAGPGRGGISLLQERLSIGLSLAKAFEQTRARSEEDEGGQIRVHSSRRDVRRAEAPVARRPAPAPSTTEEDRRRVYKQTQDSESWGHRKLRDMVARLFRAVAAMDQRMNRSDNEMQHKIRQMTQLNAQAVTPADLTSSQDKVEGRIRSAAQQLKTVLQGETTTRSIISQQEKVDDEEEEAATARMKKLSSEVAKLKSKLSSDELALARVKEHSSAGSADAAVITTLAALLQSTGIQAQLDAWCSHNAACPAVASDLINGHKLYARIGPGAGDDKAPSWRCYAAKSLSTDKSEYSGGKAYCTHNKELAEIMSKGLAQLAADKQSAARAVAKVEAAVPKLEAKEGSEEKQTAEEAKKLSIVGRDMNLLDGSLVQLRSATKSHKEPYIAD